MFIRLFIPIIIVLILNPVGTIFAGTDRDLDQLFNNLPFEMDKFDIPVFPEYTVNITDFGAVGDGRAMNTDAVNKAISVCSEKGGGKVIVPAGIWLTGPIQLKNNVDLCLESQALIQFSSKFEDYPLIESTWEGKKEVRCISPISGSNLDHIAITGNGVIDGAGEAWRPVKKFKLTDRQWDDLVASGGVVDKKNKIWWPSEEAMHGADLVSKLSGNASVRIEEYAAAREYLRPVMINFVNCRKVLLEGVTFQNSPAWNIHPLMCEYLVIRNINVRNPWYSQNGDGLDLESCKNVVVYNAKFDVGDDAICIKSGKDKYGRERGKAAENIIIKGCTVYHGHGGFTIGSEMSGGVRNISVSNCTFLGTDVGLRFKSTRGRGGVVENIYISDIIMKNIPAEAMRFNMFYDYSAPIPEDGSEGLTPFLTRKEVPVDEGTPIFRNIDIRNIYCRGAEQAILLMGLPEMPIGTVKLNNINISANKGLVCVDADGVQLKDVNIKVKNGPVFIFIQTRNLILEEVYLPTDKGPQIFVNGQKSANILFNFKGKTIYKKLISLGNDISSDAVKCE